MRILFQLPYPGYLRMFGSTIELLAERGHSVLLSYDKPAKRRDSTASATEDREGVALVSPIPTAARRLEPTITDLRLMTDYVRFLDRPFADAQYYRRRLEKHLPPRVRSSLTRLPTGVPLARTALRSLVAVERAIPSDPRIDRAIAEQRPDAIVLSPLIGRSRHGLRQTDTVKAARKLSIPVGLAVGSWDHLTTKGVVKVLPDRVFVWNQAQRREAAELHRIPPERVVVTGAQLFDGWFARGPTRSREELAARVGLEPFVPYVLYAGSSLSIAPATREIPFVRRWIDALRSSGDPLLERLGVLVRPHPGNVEEWAQVDLAPVGAAIAPRERPALPMGEDDETLYYDSIHFAAAVVGINTSAIVESFIQRRPVLTVGGDEFRETQGGTLHFRNLLAESRGALRAAASFDEHLAQLRATLDEPHRHDAEIEAFLRSFLRPHGLEVPATPLLADAIEGLAGARSAVRQAKIGAA